MSLACEDGSSKLVEVYSATYSIQFFKVEHKAQVGQDFEVEVQARF